MFGLIANLLGVNKAKGNANAGQSDKPIKRRYYKVKVKSYYGLCGIKVEYGEANLIYVPNGFSTKLADGYESFRVSHALSMPLYAIVPKDAEFITEQEYLKAINNA